MADRDGNGWVRCALGHRHWGRHGAAGLLAYAPGEEARHVGLGHQRTSLIVRTWYPRGPISTQAGSANDPREAAEQLPAAGLVGGEVALDGPFQRVRVGSPLLGQAGAIAHLEPPADLLPRHLGMEDDPPGAIAVTMAPARGKKCGRCWQYREEVAHDGGLCARCEAVVEGLAPPQVATV